MSSEEEDIVILSDKLKSESKKEKAERIAKDIEHTINGEFDKVSKKTKKEYENAQKDYSEGKIKFKVSSDEGVCIESHKEKDGIISDKVKVHIDL